MVICCIKRKNEDRTKESSHHQLEAERGKCVCVCVCVGVCDTERELKGLSSHCGSRQGRHKRSRANCFLGSGNHPPHAAQSLPASLWNTPTRLSLLSQVKESWNNYLRCSDARSPSALPFSLLSSLNAFQTFIFRVHFSSAQEKTPVVTLNYCFFFFFLFLSAGPYNYAIPPHTWWFA